MTGKYLYLYSMYMIVDVPLKTKWESLCKTLLPLKLILIDSKIPNLLLDYAFENETRLRLFWVFMVMGFSRLIILISK